MTTQPLIPVNEAATIVNSLAKQAMGDAVVVENDLSNITDFGKQYENLDSGTKEIVTSGLITLVTDQLVIAKEYKGNGVDIIRSRSSQYDPAAGLIQKNRPMLPEAVSDADVYDTTAGASSDPFKNYPINYETEYFMNPFQFRYQWSKPERWMTGMFLSTDKFYEFIGGVDRSIRNALTLNLENVTMSNLRASMALNLSTVDDLGGIGNARAVNLLATYNDAYGVDLKAADALQTPEFLRWAIHKIYMTFDYMKSYTTLFNEKEYPNFTTPDQAQVVFLSQFYRAAQQFMLSDVFNKEYLELPGGDTVSAWKGFLLNDNGEPDFASTSTINDTFSVDWEDAPISVDTDGVVATIFDRERAGIYRLNVTSTSMKDPVGLKTNYWTHVFGDSITDPYENAVTFYIKDAE